MPSKIKPELLGFLTPSGEPLNILVVESVYYLPELRAMFPEARLYAVSAESDAVDSYAGLAVEFHCVDYREEPLPFAREFFDYIISDLLLEQAGHPQDIAAGFSRFLRETGALLTSFRNIRHWSQLQDLRDGHFYNVVARLFAKQEFERLLYASYYKMVRVAPQRREADTNIVAELVAAGFENIHDDLNTEFWLVRADRSMPEMALLKSMYTREERRTLSRLLHRIEYGVDTARQCAAFWEHYRTMGLFPDYTAAFVKQAVFHPERFYQTLAENSPEHGEEIRAMLASARENATTPAEILYLDDLLASIRA